jgi:UDP-N-acetylglucosamine 2-epimerase (non-hydrolysing)
MPEQRNRILIDHMSNVLLPYNQYHRENLIRENIHPSKIIVTGNTTFEAMRAFAPHIARSDILERLKLEAKNYILVTAHRSENVDNPEYLGRIFQAMERMAERFEREIIYPMHPRTKSKLASIKVPSSVRLMAPLGFYDFNKLLKESYCVLSDSGTAAEEGLFYKVPNVSLRMATERMETIESGSTIVSGMDVNNIVESVATAVSQPWSARYELEENFSPSAVVINALRTQITNFF